MKKFLTIITLTAFAAVPATLLAAPKKEAAAPAAVKPAEAKPAEAKPAKAMSMHIRADVIDAATKTIITKRKDGVEVKSVLTDTTEIKNGEVAAKLEDIKVGDMVSGSRIKKSDTEYEVVKITKFGVKEKKEKKAEVEKKAAAPAAADAPAAEPAPKKTK